MLHQRKRSTVVHEIERRAGVETYPRTLFTYYELQRVSSTIDGTDAAVGTKEDDTEVGSENTCGEKKNGYSGELG